MQVTEMPAIERFAPIVRALTINVPGPQRRLGDAPAGADRGAPPAAARHRHVPGGDLTDDYDHIVQLLGPGCHVLHEGGRDETGHCYGPTLGPGTKRPPMAADLPRLRIGAVLSPVGDWWSGPEFSINGRYLNLESACVAPVPEQPPRVVIGGSSRATARAVVEMADELNV